MGGSQRATLSDLGHARVRPGLPATACPAPACTCLPARARWRARARRASAWWASPWLAAWPWTRAPCGTPTSRMRRSGWCGCWCAWVRGEGAPAHACVCMRGCMACTEVASLQHVACGCSATCMQPCMRACMVATMVSAICIIRWHVCIPRPAAATTTTNNPALPPAPLRGAGHLTSQVRDEPAHTQRRARTLTAQGGAWVTGRGQGCSDKLGSWLPSAGPAPRLRTCEPLDAHTTTASGRRCEGLDWGGWCRCARDGPALHKVQVWV